MNKVTELMAQFAAEHAKRDRQLVQRKLNFDKDSLLHNLSALESYRQACTPKARKANERILLAMLQGKLP